MPTTPPSITALPAPPDPNDRATFNTRAYPWSVAQQTLATEVGAVAANVFSNATEATEAAALAVPAAAAAEAASNAALWVSGATYAAGDVVWSPINALSYRRKSAGAGTTDPSADSANWAALAGGTPSLARSARTSNTILGTADKGKLIDITAGTWTQTFAAAATLGDGWWCYLRNSGTGDITLDPNASEQIDGLTSYVMYPGEVRLVQCDGVALRTVVLNAFYRTFTASGTFTKPPGYTFFDGLLWGGGGGGSTNYGGGGGACVPLKLLPSAIGTTETVTVAATSTSAGNTSTFVVSAYGGDVGGASAGGGGGGGMSAGGYGYSTSYVAGTGGNPGGADPTNTIYGSGFGGGAGSSNHGGGSGYGGGGGSGSTGYGGKSLYGGGGGGASAGTGGVSVFGGSGGQAGASGAAPAGGGGKGVTSGARGELRLWGII